MCIRRVVYAAQTAGEFNDNKNFKFKFIAARRVQQPIIYACFRKIFAVGNLQLMFWKFHANFLQTFVHVSSKKYIFFFLLKNKKYHFETYDEARL